MNYFKLIVAYDGTGYYGWQEQPNVMTVAGTLRRRFRDIFHHDPRFVAASRTDAGVHALGQVIRVGTPIDIDAEKLLRVWGQGLPSDIMLRSCRATSTDFHPQHRVVQKTYYYHFFVRRPLPFLARYGFYYRFHLDVEKFSACLPHFVGTHDFRSFCTGDEHSGTVKTVESMVLEYYKRYDCYRVVVKGPGFLRYMIRRMVGAALQIGSHDKRQPDEISGIIAERDPHQSLLTANSQGLVLRKILYDDERIV